MNCIKCGAENAQYHFRVLQVQTFHVRDFGKNSKVQALGDFEDYQVCADCAEKKLEEHLNVRPKVIKTCLLFGLLGLAGIIITALFWKGEGALRLAGLGMVACSILCIYGNLREALAKRRELLALPREKALYRCALECMTEKAPSKSEENDITYIPVDEETLARKNGDLMILYDLVAENAIEAYKRIHADAEGTPLPSAEPETAQN